MFKFADNQTVESLDGVPEDYRCFYGESDGQFKLQNDNPIVAASVKNLTQLGTTLAKERTNLEAAKKGRVDLSPLSDYGTTPEEIAEKVTELVTEASKKGDGAATKWQEKLNQQKADMTKAHEAATTKLNEGTASLKNALYSQMVSSNALQALVKHKGAAELMMPIIRQHVQVTEDNGEYRPIVVDENGTERFGGTGAAMTVEELVGELKKDDRYSRGFESESPKGTGTKPGAPSRPGIRPGGDPAERSSLDKIKAGLATK